MFDLVGYTVTKLRVFICSEINDCHKNGIVIGSDTLIVDHALSNTLFTESYIACVHLALNKVIHKSPPIKTICSISVLFGIKLPSQKYWDSYYKDKTVS